MGSFVRRRLRGLGHGDVAPDIDAPAGQLCGQSGVLPFAADCQREHPLRHDDVRDAMLFVDPDLDHLGWAQGLGHEGGGILRPFDHVYLLAAQLRNDRLDAGATLAHRRADRIEALLARRHRDLGPAARLARYRLHLDRAGVDLGDFEFEQPAQEAFVGSADIDLRTLGATSDLQDEGLDVLSDPVVLEGRLFGRGQDGFCLADVQDDGPGLHARDRARDQFALAAGVLVENDVAFRLMKALQHDLLGRLGVDPAERLLVQLLGLDEIADPGSGLDRLGLFDGHLGGRVFDLFDHQAGAEDADLAGLPVDADVDVLVTRGAAVGRLDRLLDGPDQLLPGDALFRVQLQESANEISTHFAPPVRYARPPSCTTDLDQNVRSTRPPVRHPPLNKRRGGHPRHERPVDCRKYTRHPRGIQGCRPRCRLGATGFPVRGKESGRSRAGIRSDRR